MEVDIPQQTLLFWEDLNDADKVDTISLCNSIIWL
jgi:hypothetical protein